MANKSLPELRPVRQQDGDDTPLKPNELSARHNAAQSSDWPLPGNYMCVCHLPGCENETASGQELFCAQHVRLNQLAQVLFGNTRYLLQDRWPLTAVYLVGSRKAGAVKVGVADNVSDRVATLQTGSPVKIEIFGAIYTLRDHAFKIERAVHDKLREFGFHLSGEWFDADPEDAYKLIAKMADTLELAWITPGKYMDMIANHDFTRNDVSHYPQDVRRVNSAMLATSILSA